MPRQILYFLTEYADRVEAHVQAGADGPVIELLYHPPRDPDLLPCPDIDDAANALEQRVLAHFADHGSRLTRILIDGDQTPFGVGHLGRFGVPLPPANRSRPYN